MVRPDGTHIGFVNEEAIGRGRETHHAQDKQRGWKEATTQPYTFWPRRIIAAQAIPRNHTDTKRTTPNKCERLTSDLLTYRHATDIRVLTHRYVSIHPRSRPENLSFCCKRIQWSCNCVLNPMSSMPPLLYLRVNADESDGQTKGKIRHHTIFSSPLLKEIIIVDDGSSVDYLQAPLEEFIKSVHM